MTKTDLVLNVLLALAPVCLGLLAWAAKKLADYVNAHVANKYVAGVLERLDWAVVNAVKTAEQTVASSVRAADGSLTKEAARTAKATAVQVAKAYLGPVGLQTLFDVLGVSPGEGDLLIGHRVEAAVHDLGVPSPVQTMTVNAGVAMTTPAAAVGAPLVAPKACASDASR